MIKSCQLSVVPERRSFALILVCRTLCCGLAVALIGLLSTAVSSADERAPSVGAPGLIEEIILPGSELTGKPIAGEDTMIVRVVQAFPHGDAFRYKIRFQGLEPGKFDLSQWLVRKDGSSTDDLPEVEVEIKSLLPPGQIQPNELETGWIPRLGGYKRIATGVAILWAAVFAYLVFPRRKPTEEAAEETPPASLAELLHERLAAAFANQSGPSQYAELERMLFAMWRRKLGLESLPVAEAMRRVRADETAGPLMSELERWMHSPVQVSEVDLATLLNPYREISADELDGLTPLQEPA